MYVSLALGSPPAKIGGRSLPQAFLKRYKRNRPAPVAPIDSTLEELFELDAQNFCRPNFTLDVPSRVTSREISQTLAQSQKLQGAPFLGSRQIEARHSKG